MLPYETEALATTFSLEAEARPRRLKFQPRRDRAEALLRLETASRPRRQDRGHIAEDPHHLKRVAALPRETKCQKINYSNKSV